MAAESFDPIYQHILKSEGGLSDRNLRDDPGGRTMMGVTQGSYDAWRAQQGLPRQDVARIGADEHRDIFKNEYWNKIKGDALPVGLDYALMDTAINAGPGRATKLLQRTLGLDEDGVMGNDTVMAIGNTNPLEVLGQYTGTRRAWQLALPNAAANPGWATRINSVNKFAADAINNGGFDGGTLTVPAGAQAGNDAFGKGYSVADGIGAVDPGFIGNSGRAIETGDPYGFTETNVSGNVGPGSNNLGTATPLGPAPGKYDFASGGSPGGIGDPNFGAGIAPQAPAGPAPGPYDFAGGLAAGGNTPNGSFGTGITPGSPAPAPGAYDFLGGLATGGNVPNADFGAGITQPGSQAAGTIAPNEAPTLPPQQAAAVPFNGFDAKAYLAANQDVANSDTYRNNPLQHYLDYGFKEGRTLDPQGHQIAKGIDLNQYLQANPDVAAARIDPLAHYLVNGAAEGRTLAPGSTGLTIGAPAATGSLSPSLSPSAPAPGLSPLVGPTPGQSVTASPGIGLFDFSSSYLQANPDVAAAGMNPWEHFVRFGAKEGRAFDTAGDKFDANAYLSQNADVRDAGQDALTHYLTWGANEGRAAPIIGADGTTRTIGNLGVTPTLTASLMPYLQPQGTAPTLPAPQAQTIGAPGLSPLVGADTASTLGAPGLSPTLAPQTAPIIGPDFASLIGAPPAIQATSPGVVSPYGFGQNVSQGVAPGSFGSGITPYQPVSAWGFSGGNFGAGLGAQPQSLGGAYGVGSAVSNMGMDLPGATGVSDYGFGGDVSGYDVNQGGGAPAPQEAPAPSGYGDGGAIQGRNSQLAQEAFFKSEREKQALMTANTNLFGQQITGVAPGNQTVYDYATGRATGGQAPSIQQTPFTPVNMGGVFAPLATAAFMPRFTF